MTAMQRNRPTLSCVLFCCLKEKAMMVLAVVQLNHNDVIMKILEVKMVGFTINLLL